MTELAVESHPIGYVARHLGEMQTGVPLLSGDVDRLRAVLDAESVASSESVTWLPRSVVVEELFRANAPTACEFVAVPYTRVIDSSLARHLILGDDSLERHRKSFTWFLDYLREAFAAREAVKEETVAPEVIAASALDQIVEDTALSQEKVAEQLLGVSRGTLINWRKKQRVASASDAERVLTLRDAVVRLRTRFGRGLVGSWLLGDEGERAELLRNNDLVGFTSAVDALLAPASPVVEATSTAEPPNFAVLASSLTAPQPQSKATVAYSSWEPTEDIGGTTDPYADAEAEE